MSLKRFSFVTKLSNSSEKQFICLNVFFSFCFRLFLVERKTICYYGLKRNANNDLNRTTNAIERSTFVSCEKHSEEEERNKKNFPNKTFVRDSKVDE